MIDFKELKKAVAVKNDYLMGDDDPLLIMATMQEEILRQSIKELRTQSDSQDEAFKKKLVDALEVTVQRSQRIGENIAKSGAELIAKRANEAFTEALQKAINQIQRDLALAQKKTQEKINVFWYGWFGGCVFILMLVAALRWVEKL